MSQIECEKYNAVNRSSISHLVFEICSLEVATENGNVKNRITPKPSSRLELIHFSVSIQDYEIINIYLAVKLFFYLKYFVRSIFFI